MTCGTIPPSTTISGRQAPRRRFISMKKPFLAAFLLYGLSPSAMSQIPPRDQQVGQFSIRPGSSFEASEAKETFDLSVSPTAKLTADVAESLKLIRSNYAGKVSNEALIKSAISGSLSILDPHSNYFDSKEFREFTSDQESQYSGIGATISSYRQNGKFNTYVLASQSGSPAESAKLGFGDRIIAVNGTDV